MGLMRTLCVLYISAIALFAATPVLADGIAENLTDLSNIQSIQWPLANCFGPECITEIHPDSASGCPGERVNIKIVIRNSGQGLVHVPRFAADCPIVSYRQASTKREPITGDFQSENCVDSQIVEPGKSIVLETSFYPPEDPGDIELIPLWLNRSPTEVARFQVLDDTARKAETKLLVWEADMLVGRGFSLVDSNRIEKYFFHKDGSVAARIGTREGGVCDPLYFWKIKANRLLIMSDSNSGEVIERYIISRIAANKVVAVDQSGMQCVFLVRTDSDTDSSSATASPVGASEGTGAPDPAASAAPSEKP